jgi:hypothetical protein
MLSTVVCFQDRCNVSPLRGKGLHSQCKSRYAVRLTDGDVIQTHSSAHNAAHVVAHAYCIDTVSSADLRIHCCICSDVGGLCGRISQ